MRKLIVVPKWCTSLGGATISLSLMVKGFELCGASERLCVLVQSGTLIEDYLRQAGQGYCLQLIQAQNQRQFTKRALQWVDKQPKNWPLLLENCVTRQVLSTFTMAALSLRLSGRPLYYIFRDHALSYNFVGNLGRRFTFACLSPYVLCNSKFTSTYIHGRLGDVREILYPPVDLEKFNNLTPTAPPKELQPVLNSGARIILTPSRIGKAEHINDKNLRTLIPVLAHLKAIDYNYHGVIVGQDNSPGQIQSRVLLEQAEKMGVADRFTILPPTFSIEEYYKYADVVLTLAPREPFGRTVVEAIACGVPVVGSKTGGIGEILHGFAPEWTVDPNDPVAAAEAIVRITADPNTPNTLTQGRHWVETHCSIVDYARKIIEITGLTPKKEIRQQ